MSRSSRSLTYVDAWRSRLCCDCEHFIDVQFTVGRCGRGAVTYGPSICEARAEPVPKGCGPSGYWFGPVHNLRKLRETRGRAGK